MKMPRFAIMAVLCIDVMAIMLTGCTEGSPILQAVTASEVTPAGEPKTAQDIFAPDVKTIYCSIKLATTSLNSNVKGQWYIVRSDEAQLTNNLIAEGKVAAGAQYVVLAFTRSDRLLPKGDYEVKLYFDDKYALSAPFKVQGEATAAKATLSEATLCSSIDLVSNKPIDKIDLFPSDVSKVYCSVKLVKADFNTLIKARWTYISGAAEALKGQVIANPSTKAEGREYISFSIGLPPGKQFPTGEYSVGLFIEDKEQVTLPFKVVDPSAVKWPYVSEMSTFSYADPDKKTATLTAEFPADAKEIDFRAKAYNAPSDTEITVKWILSRSADAVVLDQVIKEDKTKIEGTVEIRGSMSVSKEPFVKGLYEAKVLVNGQEMATLPFRVQ